VTGLFSDGTILQIEARLNINLRARMAQVPPEFGGYTREEGAYFFGRVLRSPASFQEEGVIQASTWTSCGAPTRASCGCWSATPKR